MENKRARRNTSENGKRAPHRAEGSANKHMKAENSKKPSGTAGCSIAGKCGSCTLVIEGSLVFLPAIRYNAISRAVIFIAFATAFVNYILI